MNQQFAAERGAPPRNLQALLVPAQKGNPARGTVHYTIFSGTLATLPAPISALPSRSMQTSLANTLSLVSGGQSDVLPPASQAFTARAIVFSNSAAAIAATARTAQSDSPPLRDNAHATTVSSLTGLSSAGWIATLPDMPQNLSVGSQPDLDLTARPASLRLERIVDSQTLAAHAPVSVVIQLSDPTRDFVASAQRPADANGLRLSGVHPQDTSYQQPPTVTPTATATIVVPTDTPYVPPTIAPSATSTPVPVMPTATPVPSTSSGAYSQASSVATATSVPATVVPPTEPPATATPLPVLPSATPTVAAVSVQTNAQWFQITGYVATGNRTATGTWPQVGRTVAVDPSVIPLGSTVYIQGLGTFVAEDTGGGVIGNHVDVFVGSVADAYAITGSRLVSWTPPN